MSFRRPHLLGLAGLDAEEIGDLLDRAESSWEAAGTAGWRAQRTPAIARLSVVNLILEPSTRTRCSFEIAEERLGAEHLSVGSDGLSLIKGETLSDTAKNIEAHLPRVIRAVKATGEASRRSAELRRAEVREELEIPRLERAIGVLAERHGTSPRAAFESLRREGDAAPRVAEAAVGRAVANQRRAGVEPALHATVAAWDGALAETERAARARSSRAASRNSSRASAWRPSLASRSPRTLGSHW